MGKFAIKRLIAAYKDWGKDRDDTQLLETVQALAREFAKDDPSSEADITSLGRDDLKLICFEYVSS